MDKLYWHPFLLEKLDLLHFNLRKWRFAPKFAKYLTLHPFFFFLVYFFINFFNQYLTNQS